MYAAHERELRLCSIATITTTAAVAAQLIQKSNSCNLRPFTGTHTHWARQNNRQTNQHFKIIQLILTFILIHSHWNCGSLKFLDDEINKAEREKEWMTQSAYRKRSHFSWSSKHLLKIKWHCGWVFIQFVSAFHEFRQNIQRFSSFCKYHRPAFSHHHLRLSFLNLNLVLFIS